MKTIVTHVRPHIDDLSGMWLIHRYMPGWKGARLAFLPATAPDPMRRDMIFVGMGRGRFDEHKGDIGESAASLTWRAVRSKVRNATERAALDRLIAWVRDEDQSLHDSPDPELGPSALLYYHFLRHGRRSSALAAFGFELLENALAAYTARVRLERDWRRRRDFSTPWGPGAALRTREPGADAYAYRRGYALVALVRPDTGYRQLRAAPRSRVNFSEAYRRVLCRDPRADWFLHHSRKLLLSGSDVSPGLRVSRLRLRDLVALLAKK